MKYELAIFDMDGTILNTLEDLKDAINHALVECGYPERSLEEVRQFVGNGTRRLVDLAVPEGTSKEDKEKVYQTYIPYYEAHADAKTDVYPGIRELLKNLKEQGCMTAVVSNKPDAAVKNLTEAYFHGLFDMAVGENEAGGIKRKPAPDEVDCVLHKLNISNSKAVYIGDSDVDVATARASGLQLIAVDWGFRSRSFLEELQVDTIVSTPHEIEEIMNA